MSKNYYGRTNANDFIAITDGNKSMYVFNEYDFNKQTGKTFSDLSTEELIDIMNECEFEECDGMEVLDFNIDEGLGNNSSERYYSVEELKEERENWKSE